MVYVRLTQDWTDESGTAYSAGDTVDVDTATLARLESEGLVTESGGDGQDSWYGPSGGDGGGSDEGGSDEGGSDGGGSDGGGTDSWYGPSGGDGGGSDGGGTDSWYGPSGGSGD